MSAKTPEQKLLEQQVMHGSQHSNLGVQSQEPITPPIAPVEPITQQGPLPLTMEALMPPQQQQAPTQQAPPPVELDGDDLRLMLGVIHPQLSWMLSENDLDREIRENDWSAAMGRAGVGDDRAVRGIAIQTDLTDPLAWSLANARHADTSNVSLELSQAYNGLLNRKFSAQLQSGAFDKMSNAMFQGAPASIDKVTVRPEEIWPGNRDEEMFREDGSLNINFMNEVYAQGGPWDNYKFEGTLDEWDNINRSFGTYRQQLLENKRYGGDPQHPAKRALHGLWDLLELMDQPLSGNLAAMAAADNGLPTEEIANEFWKGLNGKQQVLGIEYLDRLTPITRMKYYAPMIAMESLWDLTKLNALKMMHADANRIAAAQKDLDTSPNIEGDPGLIGSMKGIKFWTGMGINITHDPLLFAGALVKVIRTGLVVPRYAKIALAARKGGKVLEHSRIVRNAERANKWLTVAEYAVDPATIPGWAMGKGLKHTGRLLSKSKTMRKLWDHSFGGMLRRIPELAARFDRRMRYKHYMREALEPSNREVQALRQAAEDAYREVHNIPKFMAIGPDEVPISALAEEGFEGVGRNSRRLEPAQIIQYMQHKLPEGWTIRAGPHANEGLVQTNKEARELIVDITRIDSDFIDNQPWRTLDTPGVDPLPNELFEYPVDNMEYQLRNAIQKVNEPFHAPKGHEGPWRHTGTTHTKYENEINKYVRAGMERESSGIRDELAQAAFGSERIKYLDEFMEELEGLPREQALAKISETRKIKAPLHGQEEPMQRVAARAKEMAKAREALAKTTTKKPGVSKPTLARLQASAKDVEVAVNCRNPKAVKWLYEQDPRVKDRVLAAAKRAREFSAETREILRVCNTRANYLGHVAEESAKQLAEATKTTMREIMDEIQSPLKVEEIGAETFAQQFAERKEALTLMFGAEQVKKLLDKDGVFRVEALNARDVARLTNYAASTAREEWLPHLTRAFQGERVGEGILDKAIQANAEALQKLRHGDPLLRNIRQRELVVAQLDELREQLWLLDHTPSYVAHMLTTEGAERLVDILGAKRAAQVLNDDAVGSAIVRAFSINGKPLSFEETAQVVREGKWAKADHTKPLLKKRTFGELLTGKSAAEAKLFNEDATDIFAHQAQEVADMASGSEYIEAAFNKFAKTKEEVLGHVASLPTRLQRESELGRWIKAKDHPLGQRLVHRHRHLEHRWLLKDHIELIAKSHDQMFMQSSSSNAIFNMAERFKRLSLSYMLPIHPAFHNRNTFSMSRSLFNAGMGNPKNAIQEARQIAAGTALAYASRSYNTSVLRRMKVLLKAKGRDADLIEILDEVQRQNVVSAGFWNQIVDNKSARVSAWKTWIPYLTSQSFGRSQWKPVRWGRSYGQFQEDAHRLTLFVNQLENGKSFHQAGKAVETHFGQFRKEYFTPFERSVSSLFWFYSWDRHNIPYQLKQLLTNRRMRTELVLRGRTLRTLADVAGPEYIGPGQEPWYQKDYITRSGAVMYDYDPESREAKYAPMGGFDPAFDVGQLLMGAEQIFKQPGELPDEITRFVLGRILPTGGMAIGIGTGINPGLGYTINKSSKLFGLDANPLAAYFARTYLRPATTLSRLDPANQGWNEAREYKGEFYDDPMRERWMGWFGLPTLSVDPVQSLLQAVREAERQLKYDTRKRRKAKGVEKQGLKKR